MNIKQEAEKYLKLYCSSGEVQYVIENLLKELEAAEKALTQIINIGTDARYAITCSPAIKIAKEALKEYKANQEDV